MPVKKVEVVQDTKPEAAKLAKPEAAKVAKPEAKKASVSAADIETSKRLQAARASIFKHTGKKDVEVTKTSMPHVSSGSFLLDYLIGGVLAEDGKAPLCPGYPRRHLTEVYGAEASGKTTAALEAVAAVQQLPGGSAMYLDFEHSLTQKYARSIGVSFSPDKLLLFQPDTMEDGWKMFLVGLKAGVDIIVIDSVAAMTPRDELDKDLDKAAKVGAQASNLSSNLKKVISWLDNPKISSNPKGTAVVLINQTRAVINTNGPARGDNESTAGGKALKFYCFLRIKFTKIRGEFLKRKNPVTGKEQSYQYGNHTQAKIVKSKVDGTSGHTTDIFIRYGQGIDDYYSLLEAAVATKVVRRNGAINAYGTYQAPSKDKFRDILVKNPSLFEEIKQKTLAAIRADKGEPDQSENEIEDMMGTMFGDEDASDEDASEDTVGTAMESEIEAEDFTQADASDQESGAEG